ncbi:hypothetical protein P7K49_027220, partial [Saguinus oedipus]
SDPPRDEQVIRTPAGGSQTPLHRGFLKHQENKEGGAPQPLTEPNADRQQKLSGLQTNRAAVHWPHS